MILLIALFLAPLGHANRQVLSLNFVEITAHCGIYVSEERVPRRRVSCTSDFGVGLWKGVDSADEANLIAESGGQVCVVWKQAGLRCNGELRRTPRLAVAELLAVDSNHACAKSEGKVQCWSTGRYMEPIFDKNIPEMQNVTALAVASDWACAIDGGTVKCWGNDNWHETYAKVPPLKNPRAIGGVDSLPCALDDEGVKCWGIYPESRLNRHLPSTATSFQMMNGRACAIENASLVCWGREDSQLPGQPELKGITGFALGGQHSCAIDREGLKCWGDRAEVRSILNGYGQLWDYWQNFNLDQIGSFFSSLQPYTNAIRSRFFGEVSRFAYDKLSPADRSRDASRRRLLLAFLMKPVLTSLDAEFMRKDQVLLHYGYHLKDFNDQLELVYRNSDRIPWISITYNAGFEPVLLGLLRISAEQLKDFAGPEEKAMLVGLLRAVGTALADPQNEEKRKAVVAEAEKLEGFFQRVAANPKIGFLYSVTRSCIGGLRDGRIERWNSDIWKGEE